MTNNITELVFILDKSGSMAGLESDTIGGFNALVEKQKKQEGICYVSTVLFATERTVIHDRVLLEKVKPMTEREYTVGGCTALLDAIGEAIRHISNIHKYIRPEDVPARTIFVITTDGLENASSRYTSAEIKELVEKKKEKSWEFLFLGANIDAVETASRYGISSDRAVNYHADHQGTEVAYRTVAQAVCNIRSNVPLQANWSESIQKDYEERRKRQK